MVRVDRENNTDIQMSFKDSLLERIKSQISNLDAIIISDYLKGVLDKEFTQTLFS